MVRNHSRPPNRAQNPIDSSSTEDEPQNNTRNTRQSAAARQQQPAPKSRKQPQPRRRMNVIREIAHMQTTTHNLIPRSPFGRLLREILQGFGDFRVSKEAFDCLQEACEIYLVSLFEDAYKLTLHRQRVTCTPADITLVLYLRGHNDPGRY